MIAVIFEVKVLEEGRDEYIQIAADIRGLLQKIDGFISVERFQSLSEPSKLLSLSFWENEEAVANWKNKEEHLFAQKKGKEELFASYCIKICGVTRSYDFKR